MKKSILCLLCILGLGLSCVFGANIEIRRGDDNRMRMGDDNRMRMGNDNRMVGPMTENQSFLSDLKGYIGAYQFFKAIASSPQRAAPKAVKMAKRIVQRQEDRVIGRLSAIAQQLQNVNALRDLGNAIKSKLQESNDDMRSIAQNDIMLAQKGVKKPLWEDMRFYGKQMHAFRKRVNRFVQNLSQRVEAAKEKVGMAVVRFAEERGDDGDEMMFEEIDENDDNDDVDQSY